MNNDIEHLYGRVAAHQILIDKLLSFIVAVSPALRTKVLVELDETAVLIAEERNAGKWPPEVAEGILKTFTETRDALTLRTGRQ